MKLKILFLLLVMLGLTLTVDARKRKKTATSSKQEQKETKYQKLFKDKACETVPGMITLHKMDGKVYFELPVTMLDKEMLLGSTVSEITDNRFAIVGEKPREPLHVVFTRADSLINLRTVTSNFISKDANIEQRIKESTVPAILRNFKILAFSPDSANVVIDMTDFLLSDNDDIGPFNPYAPATGYGRAWIEKEYKAADSQIAGVKAFSDNVSVRSSLTYIVSVRDQRYYYTYKKPFTAVMTRSFVLLPEEPMRPRIADPRINIFVMEKSTFSNEGNGVQRVYFTNRWRLEPKDEAKYRRGELVEPRKPIVFYIDNTFPESWKPYIKEGIEKWNLAFEKIGFKNAVVTKDFPANDPEFDPDNLKYSCVRYSPSQVANAMGPSWTDPRTGEILNASVYLYHNLIKLVQDWRFLQTAPADADVRSMTMDEKLLGECIRYVVSHEVGHCLSLMHNMAGSSSIPTDSLRSPSFTRKYGTTYSIMDYARNNYVAQPGDKERGVRLTPPELGESDYFSIKWLYAPLFDAQTPEEEVATLSSWIAEKSGDPVYRYGKQQLQVHIDPSSMEEDLGDDPIKSATYGVKNLKYLLNHLNEWVGEKDYDYTFRSTMYNEIVYQYFRYINHVFANIGGIYLNERYAGDARPSYVTVPKERQKQAVAFIFEQMRDLTWLNGMQFDEGLPLRGDISNLVEDELFKSLMGSPFALNLCASKAKTDPYGEAEFMDDFYRFIWEPTIKGKTLSETEKKYQLRFLSMLMINSGVNRGEKGSSLGVLALAGENQMVAVPEEIKERSREIYGELPESVLGRFTNEALVPVEPCPDERIDQGKAGFSLYVSVQRKGKPMEHVYYNILKRTHNLLKTKVNTGSEDTRKHYRLLMYKLEKALK